MPIQNVKQPQMGPELVFYRWNNNLGDESGGNILHKEHTLDANALG
jgi:hypothetical protein